MLLLSMVCYQLLHCFRHHDTDSIAINKLCKLAFRYFTMYLAIIQQQGYQGILEYGVYIFSDFSLLIINSIIS